MQSPNYYEFLGRPKMISGIRALEQIPVELEGYGSARPLVIVDGSVSGLGAVITKAMYDSNLVIGALFDGHVAGSTPGVVRELVGLYDARKCDSIIVAGGGYLADVAKCVNIEVSEKKPAVKFAGENKIRRELRPLVLMPVALVSGYEASRYAFIDGEMCGSDYLAPDMVVLDSRATAKADSEQTLLSGLIALSHAIEASLSPQASPMIDAYAYASIRLLCENLPAAVKKPRNRNKSLAVANGCALAATAFSNAPAGMVHLLGEALSDGTGINPGIIMGILVRGRLAMQAKEKTGLPDSLCLALAGPDAYSVSEAKRRSETAIQSLESVLEALGDAVPADLTAAGMVKGQLEMGAKKAVKASSIKLSEKQFMGLLEKARGGN